MATRSDLLAAAEQSASAAAAAEGPVARREHAEAAKAALEAAHLTDTLKPSELDDMLAAMVEVGLVKGEHQVSDLPALMRAVAEMLKGWHAQVLSLNDVDRAYRQLWALASNLRHDFIAAGTETSLRLAARIDAALAEADTIAHLTGPENEEG